MGWINLDEPRRDLLAEIMRCDFCGDKKERRYFAEIADGEDIEFSCCKDCKDFQDKIDAIEADISNCQCKTTIELKTMQENFAFAHELWQRHGE